MTNNSTGSIRQLKDGSWEGRISVNGEKRTVIAKTKASVKKQVLSLMASQAITPTNDGPSPQANITVSEWLTEWYNTWLANLSDNARRRYELDLRLHIIPAIGKIKLSSLSSNDVQKLYGKLSANGLSPKTVRCVHGVLHSSLDKAIALGMIKANVTNACVLPKPKTNEMHPLKDSAVSEFLQRIQGHRYEDAFFVAIFTGMRESELMGLTWDCVDFEHGTIRIYRQLQRTHVNGEYAFTQTKTGKSRTLLPAESVMERLQRIKEKQEQAAAKVGKCVKLQDFILTTDKGTHMTVNTLYKPFKEIVRDMGLPETRFHDLRHTYAVLSLQSGCDIKTLSTNLGHSTITMTLDRYGHVSNEMQKKSSSLLQALIVQL